MRMHQMTALLAMTGSVSLAQTELLVGSWATHSIRRYDVETKAYLGDLVPPGLGGLSTPDGIAMRDDGVLIVASSDTDEVLLFDGTSGELEGVLAGPPLLDAPGNLQIGPDGLLYVCNKLKSSVERFDPFTGAHVDTFAQGEGLIRPVGLEWNDGVLFVSDFNANRVHRYDAGAGEKLEDLAVVSTPLIARIDSNGDLLVTSHLQSSVRILDAETGELKGVIDGGPISCPVGHLDAPDGTLLVASWQNHRILRYDADYEFIDVFAFGEGLTLPNDLLLVERCAPDCNADGTLNVLDFVCFQQVFVKGCG